MNKKRNGLRLLKIGYIVKPHGIKGELCISLDKKYILEQNQTFFIECQTNLFGPYKVSSIRRHKNLWLLRTDTFKNIEDVKNFSGATVGIKIKKLPKNFFWVDDLLGCSVYLTTGEELGKITEIMKTGVNDVYVVNTIKKTEVLIPATKEVVKNINIRDKKITIEPIPGLIE